MEIRYPMKKNGLKKASDRAKQKTATKMLNMPF